MPTKRGSIPKMMPQKNTGRTKQRTIPAGRSMKPVNHSSERVVIPGKEYVQDVSALTTFLLTLFSVNPRNYLLFPRLAAIASRYEKYHFRKLHFVFETSAVTTDSGTMFHYMDPDPYDLAASSKAVVLNHKNSARSKLYDSNRLVIDPEDLKGERFCRTLDEVSGDLRQYDVGAYRIGALSSAQKVVGELWVDYEIELISPTTDGSDTIEGPEDGYFSTEAGVDPDDTINRALKFDKLASTQDSYLVPLPEPETETFGGLSVQGIAEFAVDLFIEGTGITTAPDLGTNGAVGERKTITPFKVVLEATKLWKSWRCYFNNPTNVTSFLSFLNLAATTITSVWVFVRPVMTNSAPPPLGFLGKPNKKSAALQRRLLLPKRPVAVVEPATPVAKLHVGTCVMLPDFSSPKAPVPAPSLPRKYVLACHRCGSFDECGCPCSKLQQKSYSCDNCRHPTCLGQCS